MLRIARAGDDIIPASVSVILVSSAEKTMLCAQAQGQFAPRPILSFPASSEAPAAMQGKGIQVATPGQFQHLDPLPACMLRIACAGDDIVPPLCHSGKHRGAAALVAARKVQQLKVSANVSTCRDCAPHRWPRSCRLRYPAPWSEALHPLPWKRSRAIR
jgi:hypothetical protein